VVVEITIDERGENVRKSVLESAGPALDNKVLAALEISFHPPPERSCHCVQQDAIFHVKARG